MVEQGVRIRALILRDALEVFFGADDSPASWLQAYQAHKEMIDSAVVDRYRSDRTQAVVVLRAEREEAFMSMSRSVPLRAMAAIADSSH